ncbi:uncharacterized protein GGS22DRAFT_174310 [Annulohypoxylon maeteangense]|uniref:uncharacterized protein n=1 Tax=Annulohypoxylon maeteangense TaxID=1927788 RepID=UPI00200730A0|nr:uncharacterized protein GGS22DRAFT_174310 [Annulohypoxylon maeteangense]KAI0880828.1 hypothetical protein GGS22DRAFT_174310 [Annulohypoxylon maeteangense]
MCSSVQFTYRCGCIENTIFECLGTVADPYPLQHCSDPGTAIATTLDEECHDCSRETSTPAPPTAGVLQERPLNLPTKTSLIPVTNLLADMPEL